MVEMCMSSSFLTGMDDSLRHQTYPKIDVFLMCFSVDSLDSMENIEKNWMPELRHFCPTGTVISQSLFTFRCMKKLS